MEKQSILDLIKKGESETIEFKETPKLNNEIGEVISAFSNTKGGTILIGVSDSGNVVGVTIGKNTIEDLAGYIKRNTDPKIYPSIKVEDMENKKIVFIEIPENKEKPVFFKNHTYKRVGRTSPEMSSTEIRKLAKESGEKIYWDSKICEGVSLEDIDEDKIKWFVKEARRQRGLEIPEDAIIEEALMRLKLLKDKKLTNAAILLFGKKPQNFFLQSEVKCIRFKGIDVTGEMIDFKTIEGDIIYQLKKTEDFIFEHIPMKAWIEEGKLQRQEKWLYPPKAIREAIANALAHRDYETTTKVQVRIFDDRMEIWNPGRLPEGWTVEKLKQEHESKPFNPLIAKHFFWIKYIEDVGSGTNKIIKWCVDWGLPEPDFESTGTSLIVTFKKPLALEDLEKLGLNRRQIKAVDYIVKKGFIDNSEYQKLNTTTKRTATRDLTDLVKKNIFKIVGKGRRALRYTLLLGQNVPKISQKMSQKGEENE